MDLIVRARAFAREAHGDQRRKYTGAPYIVHTVEVARIVADAGGTPEMIAAAHLHDVVEDTPVTLDEVKATFGLKVAALVDALTDQVPLAAGNRAVRKRMESDRLARSGAAVHTIKLADIISNTASIAEHDPGFAVTYLDEMAYLVPKLARGKIALRRRAQAILDKHRPQK